MLLSSTGSGYSRVARTRAFYRAVIISRQRHNFRRHNCTGIRVATNYISIPSLDEAFPFQWLRDACRSPSCVHPSTSQKLFRTSDVPIDIKPLSDGVRMDEEGLHVKWEDGHVSFYPTSFLEQHANAAKYGLDVLHKDLPRTLWTYKTITQEENLFQAYSSIQTPAGLFKAINQLSQYGLLFLHGVPTSETSNDTCDLRILAERFSEIRETFYGRLWDVKNIKNSRNIAYTDLDLGLHMDLLYFQHPPQYQILHCLRNNVEGGTSIFVDSIEAAVQLGEQSVADFDVLSTQKVPFHYINDGHHLHFEHPTIEVDASEDSEPIIKHINYSPPFQAPLFLHTKKEFYVAMQRFTNILNDPTNTLRYTLEEGDAVLFDNRRVLHARTAFHDKPGSGREGEINRWLKGCYIEGDAMWDRGRILRTQLSRTQLSSGSS